MQFDVEKFNLKELNYARIRKSASLKSKTG
jgi:hypothetical protein